MGLFSNTKKLKCNFCGLEFKYKGRAVLKDGILCTDCWESLPGYTSEELGEMTVQEVTDLINDEKKMSQNPISQTYEVVYLGGYPNYNETDVIALYFTFYDEYLRIVDKYTHRNFKSITVYYKDIKDICMVDSKMIRIGLGYLRQDEKLQIEFYYNNMIKKLHLQMRDHGTKKGKIMYNQLFSLIDTSGIREKFRKEIVSELQEIIDHPENYFKEDVEEIQWPEPLGEFPVYYKSGYPGETKERIADIQLQFYEDDLRVVQNNKKLDISIPYKDIKDILIRSSNKGYGGVLYTVAFSQYLNIDFIYDGNDYTMVLAVQSASSPEKEMQKNQEILDFIKLNGINKKFKKKEENNEQLISVADEIKKFKELLDIGAITQEEYDQKKKELLNL